MGFPTSSTEGFLEEQEEERHLTPLSPVVPPLQQACPLAPSGPLIFIIKPANNYQSLVLATST